MNPSQQHLTPSLWSQCWSLVRRHVLPAATPYEAWIRDNEPGSREKRVMRSAVATLLRRPVISLLMPVHQPEVRWLARAIQSIRAQIYPYWELCLALDGPQPGWVERALSRWARCDSRIAVVGQPERRGEERTGAAALALATGSYVGLAGQSDELSPEALFRIADTLEYDEADAVISDEDWLTSGGRRTDPVRRAGRPPVELVGDTYGTRLAVFRREWIEPRWSSRGFSPAPARVLHLPHVLYHRRRDVTLA